MKPVIAAVVLLSSLASACVLVHGDPAPGKAGEVVLCHKGKKTMTVPREAAQAHLDHGDRHGAC